MQIRDSGDVDVDAGHQVQGFVQMQRAAKFVKAKVRNLDTGQSITEQACGLLCRLRKVRLCSVTSPGSIKGA